MSTQVRCFPGPGRVVRGLQIAGFGILELFISLALITGFGFVVAYFLQTPAKQRRLAEIKVAQQSLMNHAVLAVRRYQISSNFELDMQDPAFVPSMNLMECFEGRGSKCMDDTPTAWVGFAGAASDSWEDDLNSMMSGYYTLSGSKVINGVDCTASTCPLHIKTTANLECDNGRRCWGIRYQVSAWVDQDVLRRVGSKEDQEIAASLGERSVETVFSRTRAVGLTASQTGFAECVPIGRNPASGEQRCPEPTSGSGSVLDFDLGFQIQNTGMILAAMSGSSSSSVSNCPSGQVAVMNDNQLLCETTPPLCTQTGHIYKEGRCCDPSPIPGGGDGWSSWGECVNPCAVGGGSRSRSCQFPQYCDSKCGAGDSETEGCHLPPASNQGWAAYSACSGTMAKCRKTRRCSQDKDEYCGSLCDTGDTESAACAARACCPDPVYRTVPGSDPAPGDEAKNWIYCPNQYRAHSYTQNGNCDSLQMTATGLKFDSRDHKSCSVSLKCVFKPAGCW